MALVLVLVILPLVAIIMTQLHFETTIGERLANNVLANQQFKGAIRARMEHMRRKLVRDLKDDQENAQQGGAFDHYSDDWGPDLDGGGTAAMVKKGDAERGDEVTLYTEVSDEQGKFNLNLLRHTDPERRRRAFEILRNILDFYRDARFGDLQDNDWDLADGEASEVADAILKFVKGDERDERVRLAELPNPSAEMKQGVYSVRDLVFAHRFFIEKRLLERFTDVESGQVLPSLADFLTVYGDGKINVNTAPIQVLRSYFSEERGQREVAEAILHGRGGFLDTEEDQEEADRVREEREEAEERGEEEEAEDASGYRSLNDLNQVEGMNDAPFMRRNKIDTGRDFTVRSMFFTVVVTARRDSFLRQQRVVLERNTNGCTTWESEVRAAALEDLPDAAPTTDAGDEG